MVDTSLIEKHLKLIFIVGSNPAYPSIYHEVAEFRQRHPMSLDSVVYHARDGIIRRNSEGRLIWDVDLAVIR